MIMSNKQQLGMIGGAMTYNLSTLFTKLSILSFYLRFSIDRAFRLAVYIVMFIAVGYTVPNALLFAWICKPVAFYWDWSIAGGTCINQQAVFDSANILNMSTDFLILLLPIWMLQPLRAPLLKKIGISLVLMTGGLYVLLFSPLSITVLLLTNRFCSVCGVSTMRMVTAKTGANNPDITWHYPVNLIWWYVNNQTIPPPSFPSSPLTVRTPKTQPSRRIHRHSLRLPALPESLLQALLPQPLPLRPGLRAARQRILPFLLLPPQHCHRHRHQ
jgi:hypothetical protein